MARSRALQALGVVVSAYLVAAPVVQAQESELVRPGDINAPTIEHAAIAETIPAGEPLPISATVRDDNGVASVRLSYRTKGESSYRHIQMTPIAGTDMYMATVPHVREPGVEYYIEAEDLAGNTLLKGFSFNPLFATVGPAGAVAAAAQPPPPTTPEPEGKTNWLLIGLGILALGALAGSSSGGSNGPPPPPETVTVTIGAPVPGAD